MCDSTNIIADIKKNGLTRLGIDTQKTLVYVPDTYVDNTGTTNIVMADGNSLKADSYRLVGDKDYCVPYAFSTKQATLARTLTKDAAATVCLPYELKAVPSGMKAYSLADHDGNTAVFHEVQAMTALYPYIVVAAKDGVVLTAEDTEGVDIPASAETVGAQRNKDGFTLRGTLAAMSNGNAADIDAYVLSAGQEWKPVTATEGTPLVQPFTAYMLIPGGSGSYQTRLVDGDFGVATGIDTIKTIDADGTERYYDLNGRRLPAKPTKGIYIHDGKKIMVK
ncbi:MAG: hypothetical protein IKH99_06775, partial [Prevotella sp.]|nr:hypothetical protein [Prevotella sp.]